jgi:hypothetical protein
MGFGNESKERKKNSLGNRVENAVGTWSQNIRKYLSMLYGRGEPNMYTYYIATASICV